MMNATDNFVSFILKLKQTTFPEALIQKSKECFLDYLGCAYAGAKMNRQKLMSRDYITGKCEIFGLGVKTDALTAAFVNAFNAHTTELDDGNRFGMMHLGASIISALYAVQQEKDICFEKLITANIIAYEAGVRISLAMQPSHKEKGFHTSGTAGTIACAIAVAVALDCNEMQLKSTISAAATSAAGLLEIQNGASELKPYNIGHAALSGLMAAYTGMMGFEAPEDILNGQRGLLKLLSDNQNTQVLYQEKSAYEIERIYVKPYAACRHCHSAIEAAILLKNKYNIPQQSIETITVYTYALAIKGHDHTQIENVPSAKLSIPFSVAIAYVHAKAGLSEFTADTIGDSEVLSLTKKVIVKEDKSFTDDVSSKRIACVVIKTKDNRQYRQRVDYAKGDPENPMRFDELCEKFQSLMKWSGKETISNSIMKKIFKSKE
ncbi:MAG: MmgE/PrpD family protein [Clostridia bacterium]|nr:MmgE/PrpD family protein [Clostridia bacterium]